VPLPIFQPLTPKTCAVLSPGLAFFEIKWDGFRALARIDYGRCKLASRNGNEFKSFASLDTCFGDLQAQSAISTARSCAWMTMANLEGIANLDRKIEEATGGHPDFFIFQSLPGA
jgi:hypothetical protein